MYETLKSAIPAITARQREVVELIAEGCSNEEIGERLGISPRTAKAHSDILRQKRVGSKGSARFPGLWLSHSRRG
jgi:DNA-binding CsgD family transcriptional regulator